MRRRQIVVIEENKPKPVNEEEIILKLFQEDLYHLRGISKLSNIPLKRVREILRDHDGRIKKPDSD